MDTGQKQPEPSTDTPREQPASPPPAWHAVSRGVAWFFGLYLAIHVLAEFKRGGFTTSVWWIDLSPLPDAASRGVLVATAMLLLLFAIGMRLNAILKTAALSLVFLLFTAAVRDVALFYQASANGLYPSTALVPFAGEVALCLAVIAAGILNQPEKSRTSVRDFLLAWVAFGLCAVGVPIAQIYEAGCTDKRRPAEAIVVFPDEDAEPAIHLAKDLQEGRLSERVVLVGRDDADVAALVQAATEAGIANPIALPAQKANSLSATAHEVSKLSFEQDLRHILVVGEPLKLARTALALQRADVNATTVPVKQGGTAAFAPVPLLQETVLLWGEYLSPLRDEGGGRKESQEAQN